MDQKKIKKHSANLLYQDLAEFHITKSPFFADFSFKNLMAEVSSCQIIKDSIRRQIFHLQSPKCEYFLKRSTLVRNKDRWRHSLLPTRKWAEWRNLHRLRKADIPAAIPVLKGENKAFRPETFFLITKKVSGLAFKLNSPSDALKIGSYTAMLHSKGIYHADLHPDNIIVNHENRCCLIDVQELFFFPWMPRWLRIYNLGRIYFNIGLLQGAEQWLKAFLDGYNQISDEHVTIVELTKAAQRNQRRKYRSRSRRCCKDSTEFVVVKSDDLKGFRRRDFSWDSQDLKQALKKGQSLKDTQVIYYRGVCIKNRPASFIHRNRCLDSWKMSRAMEVRGISVPRSLAYLVLKGRTYFLSELLDDGLLLNDYLSSIANQKLKRLALKNLALWVKAIHDADVWQRDFKSNNIIFRQDRYYMIDLDGVRIRYLKERGRITNLAQLNASLSNAVTLRDRLRFFHYYTTGKNLSRHRRRENYKAIWEITKTKGTAYYGLYLDEFKLCKK